MNTMCNNKQYHINAHLGKYVCLIVVNGFCISMFLTGCKKLVDVDAPVTSTNSENVYQTDASAASVLTGLYAKLSSTSSQFATGDGITNISFLSALSGDELELFKGVTSPKYLAYYQNNLSPNTLNGVEFWNNTYPNIFICNSAIEGLTASTSLTPSVKQQLLGEAKFMRAFFYFYLVNLYGDVPVALTTDYKVNALLERKPQSEVYQTILADLKDAQNLLGNVYLKSDLLGSTTERTRPTSWVATALMARTYLYMGDWANAEAQATTVINNNAQFGLTSLDSVFLKNGKEAIWQLQPVITGRNTEEARLFIIPSTGFSANLYPGYLSAGLLQSFEASDKRRVNWVGKYTDTVPNPDVDYYYPYKYKVNAQNAAVNEYLMMFRLAEQYLIRAEARARQGKLNEALADLNAIRKRAGLSDATPTTLAALIDIIIHERQIELFTEFGHRWFDLKRTGKVDAVMSIETPKKGGSWQTTDRLYPVPQIDLDRNPNLSQNDGYK